MEIFSFIDRVLEVKKGQSLTAFFTLKPDAEFLKDHFANFPVMPGVLQLESLRQAASRLLNETAGSLKNYRFKNVASAKYGQFVRPQNCLKVFVRLTKQENDVIFFEGRIDLVDQEKILGRAILADFSLVPVN